MSYAQKQQNVLPHPAALRTADDTLFNPAKPAFYRLKPGEEAALNEHPGQLYKVSEGCIAIYELLADGRRQITDILGPGDSFGCQALVCGTTRAKSLTFTTIEAYPVAAVPALAAEAMMAAVQRLRRHATMLGRMTAPEKIASALLDLSRQFARKTPHSPDTGKSFTLYLTRADLADWLGLTLETVSRTLNQFKREGLIEFTHPEIITIRQKARLKALAFAETQEIRAQ